MYLLLICINYFPYSTAAGSKQTNRDLKKHMDKSLKWYRQASLMMKVYNEALDIHVVSSVTLHQLALSLAVVSIIRLGPYLTYLTYALYYFIFAQVTSYTIKAYFTLGGISSSTKEFLESWKIFSKTKYHQILLKSFMTQEIEMGGLLYMRKEQLPDMANIGMNLIVFFLEL